MIDSFLRTASRAPLVLGAALLLVPLSAAQTAASPKRLRDVLPAGTFAYLEAPDLARSMEKASSIPLGRILAEEEFVEFLKAPKEWLRQQASEAFAEAGEKQEDWKECPLHRVELAIVAVPGSESVALVLRAEAPKLIPVLTRKLKEPDAAMFVDLKESEGALVVKPTMMENLAVTLTGGEVIATLFFDEYESGASEMLAGFVGALRGEAPKESLGRSTRFTTLSSRVDGKSAEWLLFVDVARIVEVAVGPKGTGTEAGPRKNAREERAATVLAALGLDKVQGFLTVETYGNGSVSSETAVDLDPAAGVFASVLMADAPANRAALARVPAGADSFSAFRLEPRAAFDAICSAISVSARPGGRSPLEMLKGFEGQLGVSLGDDLFGALGPDAFTYSLPPQPGGLIPLGDMFLSLRVRDRAKLEKALDALVTAATDIEGLLIEVSEPTSTRGKVYTIRQDPDTGSARSAGMNPLASQALALSIADDWLLASSNAVSLKKELRRLTKPAEEVPADIRKALESAPPTSAVVSYRDWRPTVRAAWDMLASYAPMLGAMMAGDVGEMLPDLQMIPTSQSIVRHMRPSQSYWTVTKDGVVMRSVGSFGSEVLGVLAGGGAAFFATQAVGMRIDSSPDFDHFEDAEIRPESAPPRASSASESEVEKKARARETIRRLDVALKTYRAEHGALPGSLTELLQSTDDHPAGYLPGWESIPNDPWDTAFLYEAKGTEFVLRSLGPNRADDGGAGDDLY